MLAKYVYADLSSEKEEENYIRTRVVTFCCLYTV